MKITFSINISSLGRSVLNQYKSSDNYQENGKIDERDALIERLAKIDKIEKKDLIAKLQSNISDSQAYDHLKFLQANMDKYDKTGETIRNWTIGLWTGTLVAGLLREDVSGEEMWLLICVSIAIPIVMGIYDEIFKSFRKKYKDERDSLMEKFQKHQCNRSDIELPNQLPGWELIAAAIINFFNPRYPHVNFVYWLLIVVSLLIAFIEFKMDVEMAVALKNLTSII